MPHNTKRFEIHLKQKMGGIAKSIMCLENDIDFGIFFLGLSGMTVRTIDKEVIFIPGHNIASIRILK